MANVQEVLSPAVPNTGRLIWNSNDLSLEDTILVEISERQAALVAEATARADADTAEREAREAHEALEATAHGGVVLSRTKGQASGVAPLDANSRIPSAHIPPVALSETFVVNSQAAQLALSAQEGDVAVRTDQSRTYIRGDGTAGTMADWTELATPPDVVQSVNGKAGTVSLTSADTGSVPNMRTISTTAPLTGGGALSANRVLGISEATSSAAGSMSAADKARLDGLGGPSKLRGAFHATLSASQQNVTSNASTKVMLDVKEYDNDGWFDSANGRYTPKLAGLYEFTGAYQLTPAVAGKVCFGELRKNGVRYAMLGLLHASSSVDAIGGGSSVKATANGTTDYFELFVWHNFGTTPNVFGLSDRTYFQGVYLGVL